MDDLVIKARKKQPNLIVVDRAVHGINQNYLTPENRVPEATLPYPWESCIISGGGWAHTKNAKYMSGYKGIQMLVDIVAKGGNLLLNVAPTPEGNWQQGAYDLLKEFGDWMKVNSEAIYDTEPIYPYKKDNICFTQKDNNTIYFHYLTKENQTEIPSEIIINALQPKTGSKISLLGSNKSLRWEPIGDSKFRILIPKSLRVNPPSKYVWVFKVEINGN